MCSHGKAERDFVRRAALGVAAVLLLVCSVGVAAASEVADTPLGSCPTKTLALRSSNSNEAMSVIFSNEADIKVHVMWVNPAGREMFMFNMSSDGEKVPQRSYKGHVFRVRDEIGTVLLEEEVSRNDQVMRVSACSTSIADERRKEETEWLREHGHRSSPMLAGCPLGAFLSEKPFLGFHVICVLPKAKQEPQRLCIFKHGFDRDSCSATMLFNGQSPDDLIADLSLSLQLQFRVLPRTNMAVFSGSGRPITSAEDLFPSHRRILILIEGGVWQWPAVRVGYVRPLVLATRNGTRIVQLETLALQPRVFEIRGFVQEEHCNRILEKAGPHMAKSDVATKDVDKGRLADDWRTSHTYFLPSEGDELLMDLDRNVQSLVRIPITHAEYIQVLRYDYMGRYTGHHDYFDPTHYTQDKRILGLIENGHTNRVLTVFMYMTDVEEGGETIFPLLNGLPRPADWGDCSQGLAVPPQRGKVILFYSMLPNGMLDTSSLHGGCRVKNGTKWSGNFWVWNKPKMYKLSDGHKEMTDDLQLGALSADQVEEEELLRWATASDETKLRGSGATEL